MLVKEWMTPDPMTTSAETRLIDAYRRMIEYEIRHLPVVQDGQLIGILSTVDVGRRLAAVGVTDWSDTTVRDVMTPDPLTTAPDAELARVATVLHNARVSALPVMEKGALIGIITTDDLLGALVADETALAEKSK